MGGPLAGYDPAAGMDAPKGDPGALRAAANKFSGAADAMTTNENAIRRAARAPRWVGLAHESYVSVTEDLCAKYANQSADAFRRASSASNALAGEIEDAQAQARDAIAQLMEARATAQSISAAYDGAQALPAEDRGGRLSLLGAQVGDFYAHVAALRSRVAEAHTKAQDAAQRAARTFGEVSDMAPSTVARKTERILTEVRNGNYSVLENVDMDYMNVAAQELIATHVASAVWDNVGKGEGLGELQSLSAIVDRFKYDDEFAAAFYNTMGGKNAGVLYWHAGFWYAGDEGYADPDLMAVMAPFAIMLGTATRSPKLDPKFTDDFLARDLEFRERLLYQYATEQFIMSGSASNYDGRFLAEVGQDLIIRVMDETHLDPSENLLGFIAGNKEASGLLLTGENEYGISNTAILLRNMYWADGGEALGAVIEAGTHDLLYYSDHVDLANEAALEVIRIAPAYREIIPDGAKAALVTIADDHIGAFQFASMEVVEPGNTKLPDGEIILSYEEGEDFLVLLFRDEQTRGGITNVIAERVADDLSGAIALDTSRADASGESLDRIRSAGALQEMGSLAAYRAMEENAIDQDQANKYAQFFVGEVKSLLMAKIDMNPLIGAAESYVSGEVLESWFPTDHQLNEVKDADLSDVNMEQDVQNNIIMAMVSEGKLPPETLQTIQENGTLSFDLNGDGVTGSESTVIYFDLDKDGTLEGFTEAEFQNAVDKIDGEYYTSAQRAMNELRDKILSSRD